MALNPVIKTAFSEKKCVKCGRVYNSNLFLKTKSFLYPDQHLDICNSCVNEILAEENYSWDVIDRLCQYVDIPFVPEKWEEIRALNVDEEAFIAYSRLFFSEEYEGIGWNEYNEAYEELKQAGALVEVIPILKDKERKELQEKWGFNYDDEALRYLENLYDGLLLTQNINGALQGDQAIKICKISYEIDCRIREGADFDKLLASYDKLVKTGEFTPKNVKNASDFESMGELCRWLEKRGFENQFYDGVTRDIVDETIKNIQSWNQRLYTNESGIGDEINQRIQALKTAAELESYYDVDPEIEDYDNYENEGFEQLFREDEFEPDLED